MFVNSGQDMALVLKLHPPLAVDLAGQRRLAMEARAEAKSKSKAKQKKDARFVKKRHKRKGTTAWAIADLENKGKQIVQLTTGVCAEAESVIQEKVDALNSGAMGIEEVARDVNARKEW